MGLTSRKRRPLRRQDLAFRDDRIFIVACEDTYAPKQYFEAMEFNRLKIVVLATEDGKSAANHVVDRLRKAEGKFDIQEDDQLWLVLDTDHQSRKSHIANLLSSLKRARQSKHCYALSNPCFEVWLWLHYNEDFTGLSVPCNAKEMTSALKQAVSGYSKTALKPDNFPREKAELAAKRAKKLDTSPKDDWPKATGTHIYRLMVALLEAER